MAHIFISYSKQDIDFARYLKRLLEAEGFIVWLDETRLMPSDRWWPTIEHNIETCAAFVVIMSSRSRMSEWVERELLYAEQLKKPLFPVLYGGEAWPRLANIQYADMRAGMLAALPRVLIRGLHEIISDAAIIPTSSLSTVLRWPPHDLIARVHSRETVVAWRKKSRRHLRWSLTITVGLMLVVLAVGGVLGSGFEFPTSGTDNLSGMNAHYSDTLPAPAVVPPSGTATITPVPPSPDIRLIYDEDTFLVLNTSDDKLDISQLIFEQTANARRWDAKLWDRVGTVSTSKMSAGGCYQLVTYEGRQITPNRATCSQFLGWFRTGVDNRYFWISDDPGAAFTVRHKNGDQPLVTCPINAGECMVDLP